jgi:hypothetical protein
MNRILLSLTLVFGAMVTPQAAALESASDRVHAAIEQFRGIKPNAISGAQKEQARNRLDQALALLRNKRKMAIPAVHAALSAEKDDSPFIIELTSFLLSMDDGTASLRRLLPYLEKTDPNEHPTGFFKIASAMASRHCEECRPFVLRVLELEDLDYVLPEHSLPINLQLGMVFTAGQYGDESINEVSARLKSGNCTVRANAATALADLLPARIPPELEVMVVEDPCARARGMAWLALTQFQFSGIDRLVKTRLASKEEISPEEKSGLVSSLIIANDKEWAESVLTRFRSDADPDVANIATSVRDRLHRPRYSNFIKHSGAPARKKAIEALTLTAEKGHFPGEPNRQTLLAALLPNDMPLLNRARATLLARLSSECLTHWYALTYVATELRARETQPPE